MRSDKLQDAIGMVDGDLIERAHNATAKNSKKAHIKWTAPIAAALAVIIGLGVFFSLRGNGNPFLLSAYAVAEAQYPEMTRKPQMVFGGEVLTSSYDDWREDIKKQREYMGAGENLGDFFKATASEFLKDSDNENRVYSPLNVYMALSMLAETADGDTRQQILDLIGTEDIDTLRTQANAVWNANYRDDGVATSILASSMWMDDSLEYNQSTINTLADNYYASVFQGEMGSSDYNKAIQSWLNKQTNGLLSDQIKSVETNPNTILAMFTTIYYQARWSDEFYDTEDKIFHSPTEDIVCEFMNQTNDNGVYYYGEKFSAVNKYLDDSGSMYFILPDEGISTDELIKDEEALAFLVSNGDWEKTKEVKINLSLPKFDVKSNIDLSQGLKNLGITNCFDPATSDFTPLLNEDEIFVSDINHGARVKIDEKGVEATAYTQVLFEATAAMPLEEEIDFVLDRPFIFVINSYDGLPLFIGVVNQP